MTAFALSLLFNFLAVLAIGLIVIEAATRRENVPAAKPAEPESSVLVFAEPAESAAKAPPAQQEKSFARTSPDQIAEAPDSAPFIGERNTRATSDRTPVADAPPLPSQAGIEPRDSSDIETTESNYQDGTLENRQATPAFDPLAQPPPPPPPAVASQSEPVTQTTPAPPPMRETLLEGPNPVDVQVPRDTSELPAEKPPATAPGTSGESTSPPETQTSEPVRELEQVVEDPKTKSQPQDPAFQGFQRKTAIVGSISRTGRSALDVEDTPLGRYQATISRAVELEWQRNCVRHRDFITPGFLTVRFFVEPGGKVRSVQFVGDMETGEVQKGFTLNSIRDAEIPPMPQPLRKQFAKEPLELIFRFYF